MKAGSDWHQELQGARATYDDLKERLNAENADNPELYSQLVEQRNRIDTTLLRIAESETELGRVQTQRAAVVSDRSQRGTALLTGLFDDHPLINISLIRDGDSLGAARSLREILQRADGFEEIEQLVEALYANGNSPSGCPN